MTCCTRRDILHRALTLAACGWMGMEPRPGEGRSRRPDAQRRGEFIFFSHRVFEPGKGRAREIDYIKQFRVCLTNGYANFEGQEREAMQKAGCQLFLYLWFNGFYDKERDQAGEVAPYIRRFPDMVEAFRTIHAHPEWLLNPGRPLEGAGAVQPAYFYDYGHPAFRRYYVRFAQERLRRVGYPGIFFDYIGSWALPDSVKALWRERHPGKSYDGEGGRLLQELRKAIPGLLLFGNQAYRHGTTYYDEIDYDISESHATSFLWGKEATIYVQGEGMQTVRETFYRPWDGPTGYEALSRPRRETMAQRPRVRVFDLNYLQPRYLPTRQTAQVEGQRVAVYAKHVDRPAIFYGYALAKLTGIDAFASDWYAPGYGRDDLYFLDLGRPAEETWREQDTHLIRLYEKGFVLVTRTGEPVRFQPEARLLPKDTSYLWDVYEKRPIPNRRQIVIRPATYPATQSRYPSGRVYLHVPSDCQALGFGG